MIKPLDAYSCMTLHQITLTNKAISKVERKPILDNLKARLNLWFNTPLLIKALSKRD